MLMVISPAKTLDYDTPPNTARHTLPDYLTRSAELIAQLRELTPAAIAQLMHISDPLAALNAGRFAEWTPAFTPAVAKQAVLAFMGDVYEGMDAQAMSEAQLDWLQDHLRILSGLYGLLRPLDLMRPYRLEMGTKLDNAARQGSIPVLGRHHHCAPEQGAGGPGGRRTDQPRLRRVFQVGAPESPAGAHHHPGLQGREERPVQDHQLLRQEGPRHDGTPHHQASAHPGGTADRFQCRRLLLCTGRVRRQYPDVQAR